MAPLFCLGQQLGNSPCIGFFCRSHIVWCWCHIRPLYTLWFNGSGHGRSIMSRIVVLTCEGCKFIWSVVWHRIYGIYIHQRTRQIRRQHNMLVKIITFYRWIHITKNRPQPHVWDVMVKRFYQTFDMWNIVRSIPLYYNHKNMISRAWSLCVWLNRCVGRLVKAGSLLAESL